MSHSTTVIDDVVCHANSPSTPGLCERVSQLTSDWVHSFEWETTPQLVSIYHTSPSRKVVWGSCITSGVKAPWVSSSTSSSKRCCTLNVVSYDCVSMWVKKDYGLPCHLIGSHSVHKHHVLHLVQILVPRSLRKILHHWPDILLEPDIHVPTTDKIVCPFRNQLSIPEHDSGHEKRCTCSWTPSTSSGGFLRPDPSWT